MLRALQDTGGRAILNRTASPSGLQKSLTNRPYYVLAGIRWKSKPESPSSRRFSSRQRPLRLAPSRKVLHTLAAAPSDRRPGSATRRRLRMLKCAPPSLAFPKRQFNVAAYAVYDEASVGYKIIALTTFATNHAR